MSGVDAVVVLYHTIVVFARALRYSVDLYKSDGCVFVAHTSDFSLYLKAKDVNLLSDPSGTYRRYSSYKKTTKIKNKIS